VQLSLGPHNTLSYCYVGPLSQSREFFVSFYNFSRVERIRAMNTDKIGRLLSISGTVTRTTEVRPELMYGHFLCKCRWFACCLCSGNGRWSVSQRLAS
jgi:DNA replicative helicase MCM subunit Mcm2 (Cdc46/Mcm family)